MNKKENRKIRLKDIAELAGVSASTASMVFSGTGRISSQIREKVLQTARDYGYVHKTREKRTPAGKTSVAVLLSIDSEWSFIWHFLIDFFKETERLLSLKSINTVIIPVSENDSEVQIFRKIINSGSRAVFSIHTGNEKLFEHLESEGIPVIVVLNNNYQDKFFSICVDDFQGAYEGTKYLIKLGHKRIGFVDSLREGLPILSTDRYYGYVKALEESGINVPADKKLFINPGHDTESLEHSVKKFLSTENPPSAFFALDDEIALRFRSVLLHLGYSVPDDISIIAAGDVLDYSKPYTPAFTTMRIDMTYVGRLAVEMLFNRLNNPDLGTVHVLKVKQQLVERNSCRSLS